MEVPTISLAELHEASRLSQVVNEVRAACQQVGFFIVVDHGVQPELIQRLRAECSAFFLRPPQSLILEMLQSSCSRFAWLDFVPVADHVKDGAGAVQSSQWSLGPVESRSSISWKLDSEVLATTWATYYAAMEQLVGVLMSLFARVLDLPADAFDRALTEHRSSLRAILYPEVTEADIASADGLVIRSPDHTDWGCVTVLLPDECVGGLEVCSKDGDWFQVQSPPGSLVVNLGELLPWWTGGQWVATPHRVVARQNTRQRRMSIPYFGLVNRSTVLTPLVRGHGQRSDGSEDVQGKLDDTDVIAGPAITAGDFFDHHEEYSRRFPEPLVS